ncbi:methyltransferase domain-containing protein [Patescibacteria group bacterium]|nr:methyltransferase domain-containing protein [Patescibacteria group bacterium]
MIEDDPIKNDNRKYNFVDSGFYFRAEFPVICEWIIDGSKIIDLGCGDGSLMKYLSERKKIEIEGIDVSETGVEICKKNNLKAFVGEIDKQETYKKYSNNQFDYAICNVTIQMVMYPDVLVREMKRIAKNLIISFPNFAYFGNRLDLLFNGCMPKPMLHSYEWYNTGHIHQLSLFDFEKYCREEAFLKITRKYHLGCFRFFANISSPNFFSKETIYLCCDKKYEV